MIFSEPGCERWVVLQPLSSKLIVGPLDGLVEVCGWSKSHKNDLRMRSKPRRKFVVGVVVVASDSSW